MKKNKFLGSVAGTLVVLSALGVPLGFAGCENQMSVSVPKENNLHAKYLELVSKVSLCSDKTAALEGRVSSYVSGADAAAKKVEFEKERAAIENDTKKLGSDYKAVMSARIEYEIGILKARLEALKGTIEGIAVARAIQAKRQQLAMIRGENGNARGS